MPPFTRSRRNDTFASDTEMTMTSALKRSTRTFRAGFHVDPRTKELAGLRVKRPNISETECVVRVETRSRPLTKALMKAVFDAMQKHTLISVVALDTRNDMLYHRGNFRVEQVTRHAVLLVKAWSGVETIKKMGDAAAAAVANAANNQSSSPSPSTTTNSNDAAVVAAVVAATAIVPRAASATPAATLIKGITNTLLATASTKVYTRAPVAATTAATARPFAGFAFVPPPPPPGVPSAAAAAAAPPRTFMPQAIPTVYKNVQYRSRLEARFAHLLHELHVRFVYEPMAYRLASGSTYTIDFFFPDQQLYVELKPRRPHIEEEYKCEQMSAHGFRVTLLYGSALHKPPFRSELFNGRSHRDYAHHDALRGITWINGKKLAGDTVFVAGAHATFRTPLDLALPVGDGDADAATAPAPAVHLNQLASVLDERWHHPSILAAFSAIATTTPTSSVPVGAA